MYPVSPNHNHYPNYFITETCTRDLFKRCLSCSQQYPVLIKGLGLDQPPNLTRLLHNTASCTGQTTGSPFFSAETKLRATDLPRAHVRWRFLRALFNVRKDNEELLVAKNSLDPLTLLVVTKSLLVSRNKCWIYSMINCCPLRVEGDQVCFCCLYQTFSYSKTLSRLSVSRYSQTRKPVLLDTKFGTKQRRR